MRLTFMVEVLVVLIVGALERRYLVEKKDESKIVVATGKGYIPRRVT